MMKLFFLLSFVFLVELQGAEQDEFINFQEQAPLRGHEGLVYTLDWSNDGTKLLSGSFDHTLRIWNPIESTSCKKIIPCLNTVYSLHRSSSEEHCALSSGRRLNILDRNAVSNRQWYFGNVLFVYSVRWSPSGKKLAAGGSDNTIKIYNPARENCLAILDDHASWYSLERGGVYSLDWLSNDVLISGSSDNTIKLWDLRDRFSCKKTLKGHGGGVFGAVYAVRVSPDHNKLASGAWDDTIKIWDLRNLRNGRCIKTLEGHDSRVRSVDWITNDLLASGSKDATVKLWKISAGQCLQTLPCRTSSIRSQIYTVKHSVEGYLAAAGEDQVIQIWKKKSHEDEEQQVIILDDESRENDQSQEQVRIEGDNDAVVVQMPDMEGHVLLEQRKSSDSNIIEIDRDELLEHEKIRLMTMIQQLKDTMDKKDEELKVLQEQFHRAQHKVEELRCQLEAVGYDREAEIRDLGDQLRRAQEKVTQLTKLLDKKTSFYNRQETRIRENEQELTTISALLQSRYQLNSTRKISVYNLYQEGDYHEAQKSCNNWLCNFLCCYYCCSRCEDCCKGNRFQLRASVS